MTPTAVRVEARALGLWYDDYRRLRHRIFVVEQSWSGLSSQQEPGLTNRDPADARARFWLARSVDGALIGAVRVCAVADVFPHEELFAHHLAVPEVAAIRPRLGTLNSLLVEGGWRRRPCQGPDGRLGTVASLLLEACVSGCADQGLQAIVATAQTIVSARALLRAGFRVIDPPVRTPLHADFTMCNVGIVLKPTDMNALAVASYFDECQRRVLSSRTIDMCFADTMATAGAA
jgi:N-acyl-L-homoserine lactone synthetase